MGAIVLGYALGLGLAALTAWGIYRPAPPVEKVIEIRYACPTYESYTTTLQDVYFQIGHLTPVERP